MTEKTKQDFADEVADMTAQFLADLQAVTGYPAECIAAGAHAQMLTTLAALVGGPQAAVMLRRAADRVENLPSLQAVSLALCPLVGRA